MIKHEFRAWHEEDQVMIYDLNSPRLFHGVLQADDYILMKYTDLKDIKNKKMYENDIIQTNNIFLDKRLVKGIVKFGKYADDEQYSTCHHFGWYFEYDGDNSHSLIDWEYEIIENIYENPELLKGNSENENPTR
jgi:uncharacterized phage protein (TIGR01671 family)